MNIINLNSLTIKSSLTDTGYTCNYTYKGNNYSISVSDYGTSNSLKVMFNILKEKTILKKTY